MTLGNIVFKSTARKVRKLHRDQVLAGFAGATADAFTLFERFESKLEKHQGHLTARSHRTDQGLAHRPRAAPSGSHAGRGRREHSLADHHGNGDVLEPEQGIVAIGSGRRLRAGFGRQGAAAPYRAECAEEIVKQSLAIAGDLCIYTNMNHTIETLLTARAARCTSQAGDRGHGAYPFAQRPLATGLGQCRMSAMTPQEIVSELDRHIVGQAQRQARRGHCAAQPLAPPAGGRQPAPEITPKNILMIGPTGVGKTEIARRLAQAGRCALHQGRGHQVHRGGLCGQGRGHHHPRPGRDGRQADARGAR